MLSWNNLDTAGQLQSKILKEISKKIFITIKYCHK